MLDLKIIGNHFCDPVWQGFVDTSSWYTFIKNLNFWPNPDTGFGNIEIDWLGWKPKIWKEMEMEKASGRDEWERQGLGNELTGLCNLDGVGWLGRRGTSWLDSTRRGTSWRGRGSPGVRRSWGLGPGLLRIGFTNISPIYHQDIPNISSIYPQYIRNISPRYPYDITKIFPRYPGALNPACPG